jgi:hypothetical protein
MAQILGGLFQSATNYPTTLIRLLLNTLCAIPLFASLHSFANEHKNISLPFREPTKTHAVVRGGEGKYLGGPYKLVKKSLSPTCPIDTSLSNANVIEIVSLGAGKTDKTFLGEVMGAGIRIKGLYSKKSLGQQASVQLPGCGEYTLERAAGTEITRRTIPHEIGNGVQVSIQDDDTFYGKTTPQCEPLPNYLELTKNGNVVASKVLVARTRGFSGPTCVMSKIDLVHPKRTYEGRIDRVYVLQDESILLFSEFFVIVLDRKLKPKGTLPPEVRLMEFDDIKALKLAILARGEKLAATQKRPVAWDFYVHEQLGIALPKIRSNK